MGDRDMHQKEKRTFKITKIVFSVIQQVSSEGRRKAKHYLKHFLLSFHKKLTAFLPNLAQ